MTAIVLGSDTPVGLTIIRELGRHGVVVHAVGRTPHAIGGASRHAASHRARPPGPLAEWLPAMIAAVGARALLAVSEDDLVALARMPPVIEGCRILTPRAGPLATVLDKSATLAAAATLGLDVPPGWQPAATDDFAARAARLAYPVVVKWADPPAITTALDVHGLPLVKAEFAASPDALLAILRRYDALARWPLVQDYCAGSGLGQMLYMAGGRATLAFQHRRIHEWPPEGGISTICAAVPPDRHAAQMARSESLLRLLGWEGPAMVEYRHDPATGRYWLMEINGRFWGGQPLASACGAEFAWELYRRGVGGETTDAPAPRHDLIARYMIPETRRLVRVLIGPKTYPDPAFRPTPWRDLRRYLLGFLSSRGRYYVWSVRDPGPLLRDAANVIAKIARSARRRRAPAPRDQSAPDRPADSDR